MAELSTSNLWAGHGGFCAVPRVQVWPTEFKVLDTGEDEFIVEGRATSPQTDLIGDVLPTKALREDFEAYKRNPLYTFCHNAERPIGLTFDHALSPQGLKYKARIITDPRHDLAQLAQVLIANGVCNQSSIGFSILGHHFETDTKTGRKLRVLDRIQLHEIAAVPLGMNPDTNVTLAKALGLQMAPVTDEEWQAWEASQEGAEEKKVSGATDLALAEIGTPWRWDRRAQDEVLGEDGDWKRYANVHFWLDPDAADTKGGYKLPFAKVIDGEVKAVWRGVAAAMAAVLGARGGVDIPASEKRAVYNRIAGYYKRFDKEVPEFKGVSISRLVAEEVDLPPFGELECKADEKDIVEEQNFDDYTSRVSGGVESLCNIWTHWTGAGDLSDEKASRVLSGANLTRLQTAHDGIGAVIRAHTDKHGGGDEDKPEKGALSLSRAEYLELCKRTGRTDAIAALLAGELRVVPT